jgi:hypothetical protein
LDWELVKKKRNRWIRGIEELESTDLEGYLGGKGAGSQR